MNDPQNTIEQLAQDHYDRLFRAAVFVCGREDAAEDIVQETFLAAAGSLGSFQGRSSTYTWLYGIMLNKFRGWLRHRKEPLSLQSPADSAEDAGGAADLLEDQGPGTFELASRRELADIVRKAVHRLPAHHRGVLVLRFLEGMSYEEIAERLSCSLGTVKSRMHYALRRIAEELGDVARPDE